MKKNKISRDMEFKGEVRYGRGLRPIDILSITTSIFSILTKIITLYK